LWVAAPVAAVVTTTWLDAVLTWLALSGAACLLERVGDPGLMIGAIGADKGESDAMLRPEAQGRRRASTGE
jgi:hypothetical protein